MRGIFLYFIRTLLLSEIIVGGGFIYILKGGPTKTHFSITDFVLEALFCYILRETSCAPSYYCYESAQEVSHKNITK